MTGEALNNDSNQWDMRDTQPEKEEANLSIH